MVSAGSGDRVRVVVITLVGVLTFPLMSLLQQSAIVFAIGLVIVSSAAAVSPLGMVAAVVFTLPWFYRPVSTGDVQFPASELLLVAAAFGVLSQTLFRAYASRSVDPVVRSVVLLVRSRVIITITLLAVVALIASLYPYDVSHRSDSLREWRWTFLEPLLLLSILTVVSDQRWHRVVVSGALIAGVTVAAVHGLTDFLFGGGVTVDGVTRISGPYPHPNALALMSTRVVVFAVAWLVLQPTARRLLVPATAVSLLTVLATFSRGAFMSLATGFVIVSSLISSRVRLVILASPIVAAFIAVVVARDRMLDVFGGGSGSLRLDIWRASIAMIRDRPFRGYGPDQFLYAYLPRYIEPTAWSERFTSHAHNLLLDFWVRLGIIGCAFVICVAIVCVLAVVSVVRHPHRKDAVASAAVVALAAVLVHGMVDNAYFSHDLAMSGWLLAWLAFDPQRDDPAKGVPHRARPGIGRRRLHRFTSLR